MKRIPLRLQSQTFSYKNNVSSKIAIAVTLTVTKRTKIPKINTKDKIHQFVTHTFVPNELTILTLLSTAFYGFLS